MSILDSTIVQKHLAVIRARLVADQKREEEANPDAAFIITSRAYRCMTDQQIAQIAIAHVADLIDRRVQEEGLPHDATNQ